jgi:hypothetical protein
MNFKQRHNILIHKIHVNFIQFQKLLLFKYSFLNFVKITYRLIQVTMFICLRKYSSNFKILNFKDLILTIISFKYKSNVIHINNLINQVRRHV